MPIWAPLDKRWTISPIPASFSFPETTWIHTKPIFINNLPNDFSSVSPVLEMTGITKSFPGVVALRDVSFSVPQAKTFCIMGENGAGKSTLMKILSGAYLCHSYQGSIQIQGEGKFFST